MRRSSLVVLGPALLLACATPVHYYAESPPVLPALNEAHRAGLRDDLAAKLMSSEIVVVELFEAGEVRRAHPVEGRAADFDGFPLIALEVAAFAAAGEFRGAEFDFLVEQGADLPDVIVTARHDLDGRLVILMGSAPVALDEATPTAGDLQEAFGIGPLLDGEVSWQAHERRALGVALGTLSPGEVAYLRDLPFRREAVGADRDHAGYYQVDDATGRGEIVLLDLSFESDGTHFVGTPDRAYPRSIHVILHEIGHAIANLDTEKLIEIYERDVAMYNSLVEIGNEYVEPLNERYAIVNRLSRARDERRMRQDIRTLERQHGKIKSLMRTGRKRLDEVKDAIESPSPMAQAYGTLPGARRGPTLYGATSVEEGFAEAFALYHLDPDSVRRVSPEVHDWLAADHHLSTALYPPLEDASPPSVWVDLDSPPGD